MKLWLTRKLHSAWYGESGWTRLLSPLEKIYRDAAERERVKGQQLASQTALGALVIVVGNLTAGGTGKSPVVAALAVYLQNQGYRPGILSRGYGASVSDKPSLVTSDSDPADWGDEPVMLARQVGCAVVVDRNRVRGARYLIENCLVNLVICDDGLQHYRLPRDIEVMVLDGDRGLGNGHLLPVGPLREMPDRWRQADFLLCHGETDRLPHDIRQRLAASFRLQPVGWQSLRDGSVIPAKPCPVAGEVIALSGIGNPDRFHATLARLGLTPKPKTFADHHAFTRKDLEGLERGLPVVMTAKDAVKCAAIYAEADSQSLPDAWALQVSAQLPDGFLDALLARLNKLQAKGASKT